ncbi:MAG: TetR/AcrR family transcriptional regulator [Janthinobacterium lividum]
MNAIASRAGGSKMTLYNYYESKEALFEAFVMESGAAALQRILDVPRDGGDLRKILTGLGCAFLRLVSRDEVVAIDRLVIGEAKRLPELIRIYYACGPMRTLEVIQSLMESWAAAGYLRTGDVPMRTVALHFMSLCDAGLYTRMMWGLDTAPTAAKLRTVVASAVDAFIGAYAVQAVLTEPVVLRPVSAPPAAPGKSTPRPKAKPREQRGGVSSEL